MKSPGFKPLTRIHPTPTGPFVVVAMSPHPEDDGNGYWIDVAPYEQACAQADKYERDLIASNPESKFGYTAEPVSRVRQWIADGQVERLAHDGRDFEAEVEAAYQREFQRMHPPTAKWARIF